MGPKELKKVQGTDVEEVDGLVGSSRGDPHEESPQGTVAGFLSQRCQVVAIFLSAMMFTLVIGFMVGRDTAITDYYSKLDQKTTSHVDELKTENGHLVDHDDVNAQPTDMEDRLSEARAMAKEKIQELEKYWGPHAEKVLTGDNGLVFGFSGQGKSPTNPKSFQRTVDLIARVLVHRESLKLGFIGSSVMCAHDNCYYDSFPEQLKRFIGPVFITATGHDLDLRNGCQGGTCGDTYHNQIFCFRHMVGDDIDFLFYEWTYFENDDAYMYHDLIARWASLLPKSPATLIFNCDNNAWGKPSIPLDYASWGANGMNLEAGLKAGPYKGKVWGAVGDGLHDTTRYGEGPDVTPERRKSLGVVFRNWHPGPLGLQYISDLTAYLFLRATVAAVDQILTDPKTASSRWPRQPLDLGLMPKPSIPNSGKSSYLYELAMLTEEAPGCFTIQKSTFGRPQVTIADNSEDRLNPYKDQVKKLGSGPDAWSVWDEGINWRMVPREERTIGEICKPIDNCAYFVEPESNAKTPLVFRLPKMTIGLVVLCGGDINAGKTTLMKPGAFVAEFDGKVMDPSKFEIFPQTKCIALQKRFTGTVENKRGHIYLSIVANQPLRISQVITA